MPSTSQSRALVVGLAALVLTVGGFFLGRRLSEPEPSPSPSAPPALQPGGPQGTLALPLPGQRPDAEAGTAPGAEPPPPAASGRPGGGRGRRVARREARPAPAASAAPAPAEPRSQGSLPAASAGGRAFVAGLTQVGSTRASGADLKGFDPAAVAMRRAPQTDGAIEFAVVPAQVQAAQPYTVRVYLRNHGTKPIRVRSLKVASEMNGRSSSSSLSPRSKVVEPSLAGLLAELPGVWKADVSSWSVEVEVLTTGGDTYSSRVAWK